MFLFCCRWRLVTISMFLSGGVCYLCGGSFVVVTKVLTIWCWHTIQSNTPKWQMTPFWMYNIHSCALSHIWSFLLEYTHAKVSQKHEFISNSYSICAKLKSINSLIQNHSKTSIKIQSYMNFACCMRNAKCFSKKYEWNHQGNSD